MNITITVSDDHFTRVVNALCIKYNYQDEIINPEDGNLISNPQSKAQFARQKLIEYLKQLTIEVEENEARKAISIAAPSIT